MNNPFIISVFYLIFSFCFLTETCESCYSLVLVAWYCFDIECVFVQAEEGNDEVYCQVLLVPESEVRFFVSFWFSSVLERVLKMERNLD